MTKQELDEKLTTNGFKQDWLYTLEDPGLRELLVIRKEDERYKIYYNERGIDYYQSETRTLEDAYDYIWDHVFKYYILPIKELDKDNR